MQSPSVVFILVRITVDRSLVQEHCKEKGGFNPDGTSGPCQIPCAHIHTYLQFSIPNPICMCLGSGSKPGKPTRTLVEYVKLQTDNNQQANHGDAAKNIFQHVA